jgi:hypothetical protein
MGILKRIGWFLFYWVWQGPQTLCGYIVYTYFWHRGWIKTKLIYEAGIVRRTIDFGGISLGPWVMSDSEDKDEHELGHQRQSWILGPLYLLVIGIPSILWAWWYSHEYKKCHAEMGNPVFTSYGARWIKLPLYTWFYTEAWAEWFAGRL